MNVLHVTSGLPGSTGPPQVVLGLCRALIIKGYEIILFTTNFDYKGELKVPLNSPVNYDGVQIYYFPLQYRRFFYSPALGRALMKKVRNFDIVHIHGNWLYPTAAAAYYCRKYGIPYLVRPRGNLDPYALHHRRFRKLIYSYLIERKNLDKAAAVHFLNAEEAEGGRLFGIKAPFVIVPNGIDPIDEPQLLSLKGKFRSRYPELLGKKVILFLGRIDPIKGLDRLSKAFGKVLKSNPDVYLVIVGPDLTGFTPKVKRLLRDEGVIEHTIFTGPLLSDEKWEALVDADIFCLPSYQEGHSMALTEALMCKLPVVITKSVKFSEVEKNNAGVVVEGDNNSISDALLKLLNDVNLRQKMGENARRVILDKYTWDKVAEQMIKEYKKILNT